MTACVSGSSSVVPAAVSGTLVSVGVGVGITLAVICYYRKRKQSKSGTKDEPVTSSQSPLYMNVMDVNESSYQDLKQEKSPMASQTTYASLEPNSTLTTEGQVYEDIKCTRDTVVYREEDLVRKEILHRGPYCVLMKGTLQTAKGKLTVVIKAYHETINTNEIQYIRNQVACLNGIGNHQNIVESYQQDCSGLTSNIAGISMLMKYYSNGNLAEFLRNKSEHSIWATMTEKQNYLLTLSIQVAKGLVFLENIKPEILHTQLSAEHVLVDDDDNCGLTGFGYKDMVLQREMEEEEEGNYGAIHWKAPEVIEDCKAHSRASDVWAFGVLLHEIYTLGKSPFEDATYDEIKMFVKGGNVPEKQTDCPSSVYEVMKSCWIYDPNKRPSFTSLLTRLTRLVSNHGTPSAAFDYEPVLETTNETRLYLNLIE